MVEAWIDKGIDIIVRIDFERRTKFLQNHFGLDASITKKMTVKAFQEALARQATKTDGESRVTEISLDGAENEKVSVERMTDDFLELSGLCEFRIDTKAVSERDGSDTPGRIKELTFVFRSLSAPENGD